jgi:hypothetical protein
VPLADQSQDLQLSLMALKVRNLTLTHRESGLMINMMRFSNNLTTRLQVVVLAKEAIVAQPLLRTLNIIIRITISIPSIKANKEILILWEEIRGTIISTIILTTTIQAKAGAAVVDLITRCNI